MGKKVIITTSHRGVFFGELSASTADGRTVTLLNARMAIYWATKKGLFELAEVGPNASSKISSTAPEVKLHDVTGIVACTATAIEKWEKS
jgi:hypothetical protein